MKRDYHLYFSHVINPIVMKNFLISALFILAFGHAFGQAKWTTHYKHYWISSDIYNDAWAKDMENPLDTSITGYDSELKKLDYEQGVEQELLMAWGFRQADEDSYFFAGSAFEQDSVPTGNSYNIRLIKMFESQDGGLTNNYRGEIVRPLQDRYDLYGLETVIIESYPGGAKGDEIRIEVIWNYSFVKLQYTKDGIYHVYCFYDPKKSWILETLNKGIYEYE